MRDFIYSLVADHGGQALTWAMALLGLAGARLLMLATHNKVANDAARALALHARDAVQETFQVYVERLKQGRADGKLTPEEAKAARDAAIARLKSKLGWRQLLALGGGWLSRVVGMTSWGAKIDGLLGGAVETAVADEKKAGKALGLRTSGAASGPR